MDDNLFTNFFRSPSKSFNCASLQATRAMFILIPILIVVLNGPTVVLATEEITVYRMNHHDWLGNPYGSRSSLMNLELRTSTTLSRSYAKKCLLVNIDEIINSTENFEDFIKNPMVGGMLIIIPNSFAKIGDEKRSKLLSIEKSLISRTFDIPIYFVKEDDKLIHMYQELSKESAEANSDQSVAGDILNAITLDGYQLSISGPTPKAINDPIITNIETKLLGTKPDDQSTIVVVAHYDAFGISPGLSFGGDSNGSGAVALLELVRIFSKLYSTRKMKPSYNLVFLLSGAGKFSFLGTKKWIEEHIDVKETGLLGDVQVSICLDSLGSSPDKSIYVHVPRIPKEASTTHKLFNHLSEISTKKDINASFVPKKTFLSDDLLNWEHDRFIQRRIPGLTLSSLQNPKTLTRNSITDTIDNVNVDILTKNIEIIAETLYNLIFNNHNHPDQSSFKDELGGGSGGGGVGVSKQFINSMLKQITSSPRSQQMLLTTVTGSTYKVAPFMSNLFAVLKKFSKDTRYHHFKLDRKEPEVVFYEPTLLITNIYNIKPAILDLFLSLGIFSYLGILYLFLTNFETISTLSLSFLSNSSLSPLSSNSRRARSRRNPD